MTKEGNEVLWYAAFFFFLNKHFFLVPDRSLKGHVLCLFYADSRHT